MRENKVKRLIEKFENYQNKNSLIQDLKHTEKIDKFSQESQDLIADMDNTEVFELCEYSSKQQCPDCNAYWEMEMIYCSCGRNMKSTRSLTEFDQDNCDVTSIPRCVIKKNTVVEQSTVLLKDGRCTSRRSKCLRKPDRENTEATLQYSQDGTTMKNTGSHLLTSDGENTTSYCTTGSLGDVRTSTRLRDLKEFRLRIIGFLQQVLKEELSFHSINDPTLLKRKEKECKRLHDEHLARAQQEYRDTHRSQQIRQRKGQQFEGREDVDTEPLTRTQVGDSTDNRGETCRHLRQARGPACKTASSSSTWDQTQRKTSNWNSQHSSSPDKW